MPRDPRRARRTAKRTAPASQPKYGPWRDGQSGWTVCDVHDYGVPPGGTCGQCRLDADTSADPDAFPGL